MNVYEVVEPSGRAYWACRASNAELARLVEADQKPRQDPSRISDPASLERQDEDRRNRTRKLLQAGQLHTGEDFNRAALIFQHGSTPDDFLMAHTLALIVAAKGDDSARWIGAASLDRYLRSIGKPQIYGTQFNLDPKNSQEPFNRDLISDQVRQQLGVPPLAGQRERFEQLREQGKVSAAYPR